jgi:hypothetical protein
VQCRGRDPVGGAAHIDVSLIMKRCEDDGAIITQFDQPPLESRTHQNGSSSGFETSR